MNIYEDELEGREFDWFAIDSDENIGLFSTAGSGKIPSEVVKNYSEHDDISRSLDSPNSGSANVWFDYSALGFYVFDWNLCNKTYKKECAPERIMSPDLKIKLMRVKSLYRMQVKFAELNEIAFAS